MDTKIILEKLKQIEQRLDEQILLKKEVLNFKEASRYLNVSESHLYKLTSKKEIPHFCPQGKRLYFNRLELDEWLQQNRQLSQDEIETQAANYLIKNKRGLL